MRDPPSRADRRAALRMMLADRRKAEPGVHVLFEDRRGGRWQIRADESPARDPATERVAVALPIEVAAAIRAEIEPDVGAAIGTALEDLVVALDPHVCLGP